MNVDVVKSGMFSPNEETKPAGPKDVLGRASFLQLLVTQLQYQNPLNPLSNSDFMAQSAQFSALEEMQAMNASMQALLSLQESSSRGEALNLIGKHVVAQNPTISWSNKEPVALRYSLAEQANVTISIYDSEGRFIRTINVDNLPAGNHSSVWDGLDSQGFRAPDGNYDYRVAAIDINGNKVDASETVSGVVDGLILADEPLVSIGGLRVPLQAVEEVSLGPPEAPG